MNLVPPSFPGDARLASGGSVSTVGILWSALHEAAGVVATLAGAENPAPAEMQDFPAQIRAADGWRLDRAESELADLTAIMEHGLAALLAVNARGADPRPAARALLEEFEGVCGALLGLLPEPQDVRVPALA